MPISGSLRCREAPHDRARRPQCGALRDCRGTARGDADSRRADGDPGHADHPRHQLHRQYHDQPRDPDGRAVGVETARFFGLPDRLAARDAVPSRAQRRLDARRARPRPRRHVGGGPCDRSVRPGADRRRLYRRPVRLRRADDHQPCRHHQGRGTRVRSVGALHPRRPPRQADGDRRRSQRRPADPRRSQGAASGSRHRGRFLRLDGRCVEIREGRRGRRPARWRSAVSCSSSALSPQCRRC